MVLGYIIVGFNDLHGITLHLLVLSTNLPIVLASSSRNGLAALDATKNNTLLIFEAKIILKKK